MTKAAAKTAAAEEASTEARTEPATPAAEPTTAAERLRQVEDAWFGEDTPRHYGKVERGHGSFYQGLSAKQRAYHAALEAEAEAEAGVTAARTALQVAEAKLEQAQRVTTASELD